MSLKSKTLKIPTLLAQFLYNHKRLDIRGIGTFTLLGDVVALPEADSETLGKGIQFENNPAIIDSPDLIGYISSQTGKMKALAAADLSSHLELVHQFLNIGKPFFLEGIGSLSKIRSGEYEFTAGALLPEKLKDMHGRIDESADGNEASKNTYRPFLEKEKIRPSIGQPIMAMLVLAGIALAVWGGYTIYKNNTPARNTVISPTPEEKPKPNQPLPIDSTEQNQTHLTVGVISHEPTGQYKFILETANRKRAFTRFNMLKSYNWKVQMETQDSLQYKLFLLLPSQALDTTRVLDSLTALNGRKVYIEM